MVKVTLERGLESRTIGQWLARSSLLYALRHSRETRVRSHLEQWQSSMRAKKNQSVAIRWHEARATKACFDIWLEKSLAIKASRMIRFVFGSITPSLPFTSSKKLESKQRLIFLIRGRFLCAVGSNILSHFLKLDIGPICRDLRMFRRLHEHPINCDNQKLISALHSGFEWFWSRSSWSRLLYGHP